MLLGLWRPPSPRSAAARIKQGNINPELKPLLCAFCLPGCCRVQKRFEEALVACLEAKRLPFNVSLINDRHVGLEVLLCGGSACAVTS